MPASPDSPDRRSGKLLPALLWAGVGVAPLAGLALVLGSGERSLRIAIGLALLAVVLIGLSIVLRPTVEAVKVDLEDTLYDEVDVVREDMRNDIATAARATHRSFGEKFEHLQAAFEQVRGQLEAIRAEMARQGGGPPPHPGMGPGMGGPARPGGAVPSGVVRHTETVQVTTRSTIVDPHTEEPPPGRSPAWAGADAGRRRPPGDNVYGARPEPAPSYEESWTEQQLRKRLAEAEASRTEGGAEEPWSGVRSGDRWASVRADDRGRELRMGERRTSMHSDESGAEVRYEDRWATLRRDSADERRWPPEPGRALPRDAERPDDRRDDRRGEDWRPQDQRGAHGGPYREGGRDSRSSRDWDDRDWDARETGWENRPRALPATSDEQSASDWVNRWSADPAPEPERRRRYADEY